jgi:hypothetical protein
MTNEELILLRAEANIALGTTTGADPRDDINAVRTISGGLPPITPAVWNALTPTQQRDSLLYEKRYSLMYQDGDRWVDMRRYGLLATLPHDRPGDLVWPWLKITDDECLSRPSPRPLGCIGPGGGL